MFTEIETVSGRDDEELKKVLPVQIELGYISSLIEIREKKRAFAWFDWLLSKTKYLMKYRSLYSSDSLSAWYNGQVSTRRLLIDSILMQ